MRRRNERGNTVIETVMLIPVIAMLLVGMTQIAEITYTYYTLKKAVYSVGTYLSTEQGVNFCDPADASIAAAISFGITNTADNTPIVGGLTADMIQITPESFDPTQGTISPYAGCATGATVPPDYVVVSIPNGYSMTPAIPFFATINTISLKPQVKVPYGGT